MATQQIQREAERVPLDVHREEASLEALEAEFHNPLVGSLQDAGARLIPEVIVIKIDA